MENDSAARLQSFLMERGRIAARLAPFLGQEAASEKLLADISTYIDILMRWNARVNLTAIRDPEEIIARHFGESLFAARHLFPDHVATAPWAVRQGHDRAQHGIGKSAHVALADVGSGAGFPGIPIKLWAPSLSLTLIESNQKKATFLREVCRALTLTDVNIRNVRAESLPRSTFDVVTLRAIERFADILPSASSLVKPGGRLALLIGGAQLPQARTILPKHDFALPVPIPLSQARILALATLQGEPHQ